MACLASPLTSLVASQKQEAGREGGLFAIVLDTHVEILFISGDPEGGLGDSGNAQKKTFFFN